MIFINGLRNALPKTQHHWILSPFALSNSHHSSDFIEALDDLSSYHCLKIAFDTKIQISVAAMNVLSSFGTTCFCERAFSALSYIKKKNRSRQEDLQVPVCQSTAHV